MHERKSHADTKEDGGCTPDTRIEFLLKGMLKTIVIHGGSSAGAGGCPEEAMTHGKSALEQAFGYIETGAHYVGHFCWHDI